LVINDFMAGVGDAGKAAVLTKVYRKPLHEE
jgi:hypothetical protein